MFYSQFILAKKGPLGTIWVAAHLERKLRKNQVADTDIGDSVDSILQPEVPIALRLSSHLLLGVVRIYSRKVNYLFDDCSEALLKVKQAFRAADGDLPPEETKAPFDSITLPETFDLDDFELPDNEIFQGNNADHHTSTRDQITLQDNMDGVVYSASQFGLDDTFGDGETSSLNFDEGLDLHKEDTADHAAASSDHQLSAHAASPKQDEGFREMPANQESMIENLDLERDLTDYAQAPSTPGLVETPNIANVQEISACEDHMDEDEDHPLVVPVENSESISLFQENAQPSHSSVPVDNLTEPVVDNLPREENGNHTIDLNVEKRFDSSDFGTQNVSIGGPVTTSGTSFAIADEAQALGQAPNFSDFGKLGHHSVPDDEENRNHLIDLNIEKRLYSSDFGAQNVSMDELETDTSGTSYAVADEAQALRQAKNTTEMAMLVSTHRDRSQSLENVNLESDGVSGRPSVSFKDHGEYSTIISKESSQEASFSVSSLQLPRGVSDDNQIASYEGRSKDTEVSRNSNRPVCSDGTLDLNFEHRGGLSSVDKPGDTRMFSGAVFGEMPRNQLHVLRPCGTGLELADSSHNVAPDVGAIPWKSRGGEERIHVSEPAVVVQGMLKNVSGSLGAVFSAPPEKQFSVVDVHNNQPRDIPESTRMFNGAIFDEMPHAQLHNLRPSRAGLELSDSSHDMAPNVSTVPRESPGGRETIHASGPAVSVQGLIRESPGGRERIHMSRSDVVLQDDVLKHNLSENRTARPGSIQDIHSGSGKFYNQLDNVVGGDSMLKNVSGSYGAMFPAPEKQLSVLDVHNNNQPKDLPDVTRMFDGAVFDEMPRTQLHKRADSLHDMAPNVSAFHRETPGGRERIHVSRPAVVVQDDALERNLNENHTAGPASIKDIHAGSGNSYNQVNNVVGGDSMFKNVSGSLSSVTSAPEKQLSVQDVHNNQPRDLPENTHMFNGAVFDEMSRTQLHMLRPSRTGLEPADSSHGMPPNVGAIPRESPGGWKRIHGSGPAVSVQDNTLERNLNENRTAGPGLTKDIHASYGISYNQVNSVVGGDSMFKNVSGSPSVVVSAPEKRMSSALDMRNNQPRDLPQDTRMFNGAGFDEMAHNHLHIPRPHRTDSSHPRGEVSNVLDTAPNFGAIPQESPGGWERFNVSGPAVVVPDNALEHNLNKNHTVGPGSVNDIHAGSGRTYNQVNYAVGGDSMLRNVSGSLGPMYSAPETLMSVPDVRINQPRNLPVQATPRNVASLFENNAGSGINSWTNRSYTESTPTEQSLNSVESARVVGSKRSAEAIRDDDGLSSILVGRGSFAMNVKSTPPLPPPTSVKRQRRAPKANAPLPTAPRASANKRKVLMDDMLVLHGDIIRQQLINTSDIRRLRRKAPSMRPESSVILKLSLEEEIFGEPLCSGTSVVLASLFNQSYNIRRIKVLKDDDVTGTSVLLSSSDKKSVSANESFGNAPGSAPSAVVVNDTRDHGEYAAVKNNADSHLEHKLDADNELGVGPGITEMAFNPTVNKEEIREPFSHLRNIGENEIGSTNVHSEAVDIAPMASQDKGVGAEISVEVAAEALSSDNLERGSYNTRFDTVNNGTVNAVESNDKDISGLKNVMFDASLENGSKRNDNEVESNDNDISGSKNVMPDASLMNGSKSNVNDVRFETVNTGDTDVFEANDNDISGSENEMFDDSFSNGSMDNDNDMGYDDAADSGDDTVTVNEIEANEKDGVLQEGDKRADIVETERFYGEQPQHDDACGTSNEIKNDASKVTSGGSPVVTSLYPPGFGTSGEESPVVVTSLCPPGFSTSGGSPAVTSLYPPGFGVSGGSPPLVASLYPPGFADVQGSVLDNSKSPIQQDVNPANAVDDGKSSIQQDVNPANAVDDGISSIHQDVNPANAVDDGISSIHQDVNPANAVDDDKSSIQQDVNPANAVDEGKSSIQQDVNPTNVVGAESSDDGKSPIQQDDKNTAVAESPDLDTRDYNDINNPDAADDTGFLNDDDDNDYEAAEVADDDVPNNGEDTRFIENSGWSSRTRAVANYLQTVFSREAEYDKKVVPIDNLLVGKTRKEACRMFFETLVLKTKDYIQVEQEGPFGNINVKPKMKLLKSDF